MIRFLVLVGLVFVGILFGCYKGDPGHGNTDYPPSGGGDETKHRDGGKD